MTKDDMINALFEKGLKADRNILSRVYDVSLFVQSHITHWNDELRMCEFKHQALARWLPLWREGLTLEWMKAEVDQVFSGLPDDVKSQPMAAYELAMNRMRFIRNLFQTRSIYREVALLNQQDHLFIDQMKEYSLFAELVFDASERAVRGWQALQWKASVVPPAMMIFALGKLGATELNLSSDVDLIFCYNHEAPYEDDKERSVSEFYTRLGQRLIKFLGEHTEEGIVYRVDMRLRPFGQSGALVWSAQALETYYEQQGRMWERYAWIKARPLTGGVHAAVLQENMKPFVYRRYVDFGVIEALRDMKAMIEREVSRKDSGDNIKIGRGGIREVEFIVQVVQLIRGGEFPELCQYSLMEAMAQIEALELLPARVIHELKDDYLYLRRVEHLIQAYQDRQTQCLPASEPEMESLIMALGLKDPAAFFDKLHQVRTRIHTHFQETIRPQRSEQTFDRETSEWAQFWPDRISDIPQKAFIPLLQEFRESRAVSKSSEISIQRLDELMPLALAMLETVTQQKSLEQEATLSHQLHVSLPELEVCWVEPTETLKRFLAIVEAIMRRSVYLSLLIENPSALLVVIQLCGMTSLVPDKLARFPSLLEEFVDDRPVYQPPSKESLSDELRQHLMRVPEDDYEQQLNRLRAFKQRHTLRAAKADITGQLSLMNVSDYLTWLAEASLQAALDIAWRKLVQKYGEPAGYQGSGKGFLIVGYGKLGGIEMSYSSDLDIVFLYDAPLDGETDGPRKIENSLFYMQLVKNLNHILMTDTLDGRLYEIDMRLRPSGSAGLFVSTFEGFQRYQEKDAWVWERQALVRSRPVAGDRHLFTRFNALRTACLATEVDQAALKQSVLEMLQKMKSHLSSKTDVFDLKYGDGGLVDIEFLAQHIVLSQSVEYPAITRFSDNVRIFETAVKQGILFEEDAHTLTQAYLIYRALIHRLSLQQQSNLIDPQGLTQVRQDVIDVCSRWYASVDKR